MTVCDLNSGLGQLAHAFSQLKQRCTETKAQWNDEASRQFEDKHLREVPARLQQYIAAVQNLAAVLEKAERECQDRGDL